MVAINFVKKHALLCIFALLYISFAILTYKQYGITSDEKIEYDSGKLLLNYFSKPTKPDYTLAGIQKMDEKSRQLSSPLFSPYTRTYSMMLNMLNPVGYYEWFHLLNLLFALPLFICVYFCVYAFTKNQKTAVLGPIFLFLIPSFSGQIPANPKDVPFAVFYLFSLATIYFLGEMELKNKHLLLLGILFGITASLRILGLSLFIIYILYYLFVLKNKLDAKFITDTVLLIIVSAFVLVVQWPYLGMNFFQNFKEVALNSKFFYLWDKKILFFGRFLSRDERPWYYLPVLFALTTPLFISFLFLLSFINKTVRKYRLVILFYMAIGINSLVYLLLDPVIYNGIRHFLFFLPLVVVISTLTFIHLLKSFESKRDRLVFSSAITLSVIAVVFQMYRLFPYHYIYFNELTGGTSGAVTKFDTDYWGASYKEAAEWFRDNLAEGNGIQKVYSCNNDFAVDYYSFKKFTVVIERASADYILCDVTGNLYRGYTGEIVHTIQRGDVPLVYVEKNVKTL